MYPRTILASFTTRWNLNEAQRMLIFMSGGSLDRGSSIGLHLLPSVRLSTILYNQVESGFGSSHLYMYM